MNGSGWKSKDIFLYSPYVYNKQFTRTSTSKLYKCANETFSVDRNLLLQISFSVYMHLLPSFAILFVIKKITVCVHPP